MCIKNGHSCESKDIFTSILPEFFKVSLSSFITEWAKYCPEIFCDPPDDRFVLGLSTEQIEDLAVCQTDFG